MRHILIAIALIMGLATTTGFVFSRMTQNMTTNINARDLPEHGLVIIKPTDAEFDGTVAQLLKGVSSEELESLKPFFVLIRNNGNKTVVAYTIIWEGVELSGRKKPYIISHANSEAFIDLEEYLQGLTRTNLDDTIKPGSARVVSILPLPQAPGGAGGGGGGGGSGPADTLQNNRRLQNLSPQLSNKYVDLTVSIDGVFFDDGTYAGPDTTNFFDNLRAQVDAKRDLINEVSDKLKLGKAKDEIFKDIEAKAIDKSVTKRPDNYSSPADYYRFFGKYYANQFLQFRKTLGDDKALEKVLKPKKKSWQNLRKLSN